ncbi:MAG TPA: nitrous oxide reductase family maturation protein NosD [Longimicrobiales bacterium]|nr:nitrous oxide reductase family maturation protein NosD [Longimicrobiales bacterium]
MTRPSPGPVRPRGLPRVGIATALLGVLAGPLAGQARIVGGGEFATLAEAVAAAAPHDTVIARSGLHAEGAPLVLDRPVTLRGEAGAVLDGGGLHEIVVVEADSVTVEGLVLRDTGASFTQDRAAIRIEGARFCTIRANRIENAFFGIYLANAGDCRIQDNELAATADRETGAGNGIHLWYSIRILLEGNTVRGHRDGIYFEFVEDSRVRGNLSADNLRYGLHFMFSDGCTYQGNVFRRNGAGVAVMYTSDVVMEDNDFDENRGGAAFGLLLKEIRDSRIAGNRFRRNSVALHLEGANRVEVTGNEFLSNGWAVEVLANSDGSRFRGNNFVANSFDVATNSRSTSSLFAGNYWDRYRGYDLDRDGVGDTPFRPVRLFSLVVEQNEPALVLHRSLLVSLLDIMEAVVPVLTPSALADEAPSLSPLDTAWRPS